MTKSFSSGRNLILSFLFNGIIILFGHKIIELIVLKKDLLLIPALILSILLICLLWYSPLKYIVENESFYVISGWKKSKKIPISSFTTIKKSRTPIAGPARGTRRIEIETTGGDLIIISPREWAEFIRLIKEINPKVKTPGLK